MVYFRHIMKLRSTTPASISKIAKRALIFATLLAMVAVPLQLTNDVSADQYDDKIAQLQRDIAKYQAENAKLNKEANTLKAALSQLANQKAAIQAQINISQAKHDRLILQIAATEKKIKANQEALGKTIADLYVDDKISPIEMLASSKNIGEYMDKQEYRSSVRNQLVATISEIKSLKKKLVKEKAAVAKVLADQKSQRDQLAAKEGEQQRLLNETRGQEAGYQNLIRDSRAAIAEARATQAALNARINSGGGGILIDSGLLTDYPWNDRNCYVDVNALSHGGAGGNGTDGGADGIGNDGYGCRQCTSYAAWRVAKETGIFYENWGNGGSFAAGAISAGYKDYGSRPTPNTGGYIAVMWGNPGHVAWIDSVNGDGSRVVVEQYNYNYGTGWGMYSMVDWPTSTFNQYVKIK